MRPIGLALLAVALAGCAAPREPVAPRDLPPIVPLPASFTYGVGSWKGDLSSPGYTWKSPDGTKLIDLTSAVQLTTSIEAGKPESYRLDITPSGAEIVGGDAAGLFYGRLTLQQLVAAANGGPVRAIRIEDAPRFRYRGMHLDVARHFMPVEFVKRYIDLMSRFKLNTFHWHLTDDQGWRIQIAKYPRLTEVGGCRKETMVEKNFSPYVGDGTPHCGFYTQDEIRDVVAYARQRFVTVIPEIEMPGHAKAALAAYPELACTPGPFETRTTWGVDEDVFCPKEETFQFIGDVLTEVAALFPGPYIHIGGDEVPKTRWRASPVAQEVMQREHLADPAALQSWFIRRVEQLVLARGKRLIGWDEILEGGLAPEATVMSWRGSSGGIAAARENHDVIMSPNSHLYFDAYQGDPKVEPLAIGGFLPLERVYEFEPVPDSLTPEQAAHILGAQSNLWTEYITTPSQAEYMAWPRALALAEVTWSPRTARSWESFKARLPWALRALDQLEVNYRLPDVEGLDGDRLTLTNSVTVRLSSVVPTGVIHYTTDGTEPTRSSPIYTAPFTVAVTATPVTVSARAFSTNGRATAVRSAKFTRTTLTAAARVDPGSLDPGAKYEYAEVNARMVAVLDTARVVRAGVVSKLEHRGDERAERYGIRFSGFIRVPEDAVYEFSVISDDGSNLSVAGKLVVDNDGYHGAEEKTGMIALARGLHPFTLRYAQATGGAALSVRVRRDGQAWQPVPPGWLYHVRF
jgi:hexosaminidase